jgi:hypothetical protein
MGIGKERLRPSYESGNIERVFETAAATALESIKVESEP